MDHDHGGGSIHGHDMASVFSHRGVKCSCHTVPRGNETCIAGNETCIAGTWRKRGGGYDNRRGGGCVTCPVSVTWTFLTLFLRRSRCLPGVTLSESSRTNPFSSARLAFNSCLPNFSTASGTRSSGRWLKFGCHGDQVQDRPSERKDRKREKGAPRARAERARARSSESERSGGRARERKTVRV